MILDKEIVKRIIKTLEAQGGRVERPSKIIYDKVTYKLQPDGSYKS